MPVNDTARKLLCEMVGSAPNVKGISWNPEQHNEDQFSVFAKDGWTLKVTFEVVAAPGDGLIDENPADEDVEFAAGPFKVYDDSEFRAAAGNCFTVAGDAPAPYSNYAVQDALKPQFGRDVQFDSEMGCFFAYTKTLDLAREVAVAALRVASL